ncbi:MAG: nucleotidyltransferase domain-containing protein [Lachnospiraceae bacterium]|nr:nucleotidyltransferase domain-containing protein [Lachnospiraceae bacterium]
MDDYYLNTGIKINVIKEIKSFAIKHGIQKVILFGSRARGDYKERSDIDLAIVGGNGDLFALDVDEYTSTLLMYDVVNLDKSVQEELLESIQKEGMILYEKV